MSKEIDLDTFDYAVPDSKPYLVATMLIFLCGFASSLLFSTSDLKSLLIAFILSAVVPMLMVIPIQSALKIYFAYLLVDGAIKVNSNYNPIFHVAQDLLMIVLLFRSTYGKENSGFSKFGRTPLIGLGFIFLGWILIQYINPFGLGLLPSIAGTKIYLSTFAFFLLIYHHVPRSSIPGFLRTLLFLSMLEGCIGLVEYFYGQDFMMALHPFYRDVIENIYKGAFYRPFGTTSMAGGPATWIAFSAPICGYFLQKRDAFWTDRILAILFLFIALPTLLVCQVRSLMLMGAAGFLISFCRPSGGLIVRVMFALSICSVFGFFLYKYSNTNTTSAYAWTANLSTSQREILFQRVMTLGNKDTYTKSRTGGLEESLALADKTLLGIGLSRVGAAAAVWVSRIDSDPYFGRQWSFADSLYRAIFTEVGLFGLCSWLIFVLSIIGTCLFYSMKMSDGTRDLNLLWTMGAFNLVLLVAGYGSEGVLYNPIAAVFWAFQAIGLKEVFYEYA